MRIHEYARRPIKEVAADRLEELADQSTFYIRAGNILEAIADRFYTLSEVFNMPSIRKTGDDLMMSVAVALLVPMYCKIYVQEYFVRRRRDKSNKHHANPRL